MEVSNISILHRKLQCLRWVLEETGPDVMASALASDLAMSKDDVVSYQTSQDKTEWLFIFLEKGLENDKLQLVSYEWEVLPLFKAKVQVVTSKRSVEFERCL